MVWRTRDGRTSEPTYGRGTVNRAGEGVRPSEALARRQARARLAAMEPAERAAFVARVLWGDGIDDE
jgi:hypothetical protein